MDDILFLCTGHFKYVLHAHFLFYLKCFYHIIYGHPDKYALKDNPLHIHSNLMHSYVIFFILSFHISGAMQPYARGDPH